MSDLDFLSPDAVAALERLIDERVRQALAERPQDGAEPTAFLTIPEAAELLRCKRQRIYDLLSAGRLTRYKDGSRTLVSRAEIERHLDATTKAAERGYLGRS